MRRVREEHSRSGRRANAFSLIELLVVIAVIGVLLSIMLPSLASARESGRKSVCLSNVRQIALGLDTYANDHADRYAPGAADVLGNLNRWHGSRVSRTAAFSPEGGSLTNYLSPPGDAAHGASVLVRSCPTFAPITQRLGAARIGFERSCGGYGYNNAFVGVERELSGGDPATGRVVFRLVTDRVGAKRAGFASPARTLAFADAALADGNGVAGVIEYSFLEPRFWPDFPRARPDPSMHFRHARRANAAWLDGHVSGERQMFSWSSGLFPTRADEHGVGWTGTDDDNGLFCPQ